MILFHGPLPKSVYPTWDNMMYFDDDDDDDIVVDVEGQNEGQSVFGKLNAS